MIYFIHLQYNIYPLYICNIHSLLYPLWSPSHHYKSSLRTDIIISIFMVFEALFCFGGQVNSTRIILGPWVWNCLLKPGRLLHVYIWRQLLALSQNLLVNYSSTKWHVISDWLLVGTVSCRQPKLHWSQDCFDYAMTGRQNFTAFLHIFQVLHSFPLLLWDVSHLWMV